MECPNCKSKNLTVSSKVGNRIFKCLDCNYTVENGICLYVGDKLIHEWFMLALVKGEGFQYIHGQDGEPVQFEKFDEANEERIYLQPDYEDRIVVLRETRQVISA